MPECQKIKNGGLHQYGAERFGRLVLPQSEKVWAEGVKRMTFAINRDKHPLSVRVPTFWPKLLIISRGYMMIN